MKKIISAGVAFLLVFALAGCNTIEATEESTYAYERDDFSVEVTYYHKGDRVKKEKTTSIIDFTFYDTEIDEETKKRARELFSGEKYQGFEGITHEVIETDTEIKEVLEVDFEKVDSEKAKTIPGIKIEGNTKNGISLKKGEASLLEAGLKKVEKA